MVSSKKKITCPKCGNKISLYHNPVPTVDAVIEYENGIVLISRKNPPYGWALPGGFVDYGEAVEEAAVREAREETGLKVKLTWLVGVYSVPERDPRQHTISTVFAAVPVGGSLAAGDDAAKAVVFSEKNLPEQICFDHRTILGDYFSNRKNK